MNKASFKRCHEEFDAWMLIYGEMLKRLVEAKRVVRTKPEKLEIVEAFVRRCTVRWELLVTWDMLTSLNRDCSQYAMALGLKLPRHLSYDECKAILYGPRYLDFKGTEDILRFSKKYLVPALNPFLAVPKGVRDRIDEFLLVRNVLAHYSDASIRSYKTLMKDTYDYSRIPEPGAFLISVQSSGQYRWGEYILNFLQASEKMLQSVS